VAVELRAVTLFQFLDRLERAKMYFHLGRFRDSVVVLIDVPGEHWEVEFFEDGHVDVEVFRSEGGVEPDSDAAIDRLFNNHSS
jgi:hypothetical protein